MRSQIKLYKNEEVKQDSKSKRQEIKKDEKKDTKEPMESAKDEEPLKANEEIAEDLGAKENAETSMEWHLAGLYIHCSLYAIYFTAIICFADSFHQLGKVSWRKYKKQLTRTNCTAKSPSTSTLNLKKLTASLCKLV